MNQFNLLKLMHAAVELKHADASLDLAGNKFRAISEPVAPPDVISRVWNSLGHAAVHLADASRVINDAISRAMEPQGVDPSSVAPCLDAPDESHPPKRLADLGELTFTTFFSDLPGETWMGFEDLFSIAQKRGNILQDSRGTRRAFATWLRRKEGVAHFIRDTYYHLLTRPLIDREGCEYMLNPLPKARRV